MKRRSAIGTWTRLAGALLLCSFAGSVAADIQVPGGTPPPGTTTWILISKPTPKSKKRFLGGVQLHAQGAPDGRLVGSGINPTTGAQGDIRGPHPGECECDHYHGTLFGKDDPRRGRGCGWGCVVRFDLAPDSLAFTSAAVMFEARAEKKAIAGDLNGAIDDLEQSLESIQGARESEPEFGEGRWDPRDSREYSEALEHARKYDAQAIDALMKALSAKGNVRDRLINTALDRIFDALKLKRKMVLKLAKELRLASPR